ncbi:hypothetical protein P154DRAFT_567693 [Amniculicola lignicola CBS 123094]|uniref:Uncharacterized protein n=1 Tax=Amniculicola lignicola CBS 123094 TaxID=1392246 RepID=A0A6A5W8F1_9PLEO|nr:hypothetical protein P154DRAFT_567693 [Amniculicola lignicola CBS 123094]
MPPPLLTLLSRHGFRQTWQTYTNSPKNTTKRPAKPKKKLIFVRHKVQTPIGENGGVEETTRYEFQLVVKEGQVQVYDEETHVQGQRRSTRAKKYKEVRNTGFDDPAGELKEVYLGRKEHESEKEQRVRRKKHRTRDRSRGDSDDDAARRKGKKGSGRRRKTEDELVRARGVSQSGESSRPRKHSDGLHTLRGEARRLAEEESEEDVETEEEGEGGVGVTSQVTHQHATRQTLPPSQHQSPKMDTPQQSHSGPSMTLTPSPSLPRTRTSHHSQMTTLIEHPSRSITNPDLPSPHSHTNSSIPQTISPLNPQPKTVSPPGPPPTTQPPKRFSAPPTLPSNLSFSTTPSPFTLSPTSPNKNIAPTNFTTARMSSVSVGGITKSTHAAISSPSGLGTQSLIAGLGTAAHAQVKMRLERGTKVGFEGAFGDLGEAREALAKAGLVKDMGELGIKAEEEEEEEDWDKEFADS